MVGLETALSTERAFTARNLAQKPHSTSRLRWLRATVLGANDGILSTFSLIAGAMSMATREYVSVSSQVDSEKADLTREKRELSSSWNSEVSELANIYRHRGLDETLAHKVALQLMQHDALNTHARDELGITCYNRCSTIQLDCDDYSYQLKINLLIFANKIFPTYAENVHIQKIYCIQIK